MAALYSRAGPSKKFSGEVVRLVITITGRLTFKLLGLVHQSSMMIGGKKERSQRRLAQTYWDIFYHIFVRQLIILGCVTLFKAMSEGPAY